MITLNNICKSYTVAKRSAGLAQAFKALFKRDYERIEALQDISFHIDPGEIVGYIGPNGAGKSTTIKVMSGILVPDRGTCNILGYTPWKDRIAYVKHIGVVFGQRSQLWWDLPVIDSYQLLKDIYKIPSTQYHQMLNLLVETLDLQPILHTPVRQLSLGQRMRCEIAASLLHDPKILFLDEPTIGLDAVSKIAVRKFIQHINKEKGVTIVLTTHDMSDIEALADRILLIGKGRLLFDGNIEQLRKRFGAQKTITIQFKETSLKPNIEGTTLLSWTPDQAVISINEDKMKVSEVIAQLSQMFELVDINIEDQPIEETIVHMYKEYDL